MTRLFVGFTVAGLLASTATGQPSPPRPPVIDMHVHSTNTSPQELARLNGLNVRFVFLAGLASDLRDWAAAVDTSRYMPAPVFPCLGGRAPITGRPCFDKATDFSGHGMAS